MPHTFTLSSRPTTTTLVQQENDAYASSNSNQTVAFCPSTTSLVDYYTQPQITPSSTDNLEHLNNNLAIKDKPKQTRFKQLYPNEEYDPEQQEYYRAINEVPIISKPGKRRKIDVRVRQEGNATYLFTKPQLAETVVIDAHGSYDQRKHETIELKKNSPTIIVYGPHDHILSTGDISHELKKPYAEISYEGIKAFSEHAAENLNQYWGYQKITGTNYPRHIRNYSLSKYSDSAHFPDLISNYREFIALAVEMLEKRNTPYDIYAIRKKRAGQKVSAKMLTECAQKRGYKKIAFIFCRTDPSSSSKEEYFPTMNKELPSPVFKSWEEIAEFEKAEDLKKQQQRLAKLSPLPLPKKKKSKLSKIKNFFKKKDSHH